MGALSRRKGAVGERELAAFLTEHGHPARRGQQFSGSPESPDVVCPSLSGFHFEVKRIEALRIHDALAQAVADAGDKIPLVVHRRSRGEWIAVLRLTDLLRVAR